MHLLNSYHTSGNSPEYLASIKLHLLTEKNTIHTDMKYVLVALEEGFYKYPNPAYSNPEFLKK
jgi:hypothetical protein